MKEILFEEKKQPADIGKITIEELAVLQGAFQGLEKERELRYRVLQHIEAQAMAKFCSMQ